MVDGPEHETLIPDRCAVRLDTFTWHCLVTRRPTILDEPVATPVATIRVSRRLRLGVEVTRVLG